MTSQMPACHLHCLATIQEPVGKIDRILQLPHRLKRFAKRRRNLLVNKVSRIVSTRKDEQIQINAVASATVDHLQPGDMVRIRSKEEIRATLDDWNRLKGCGFLEEMWPYCSTVQRVYKRVEQFMDERDYVVKKCRNLVILDGVFCHGTVDFGKCDRTCFFFWREEWLEKIS